MIKGMRDTLVRSRPNVFWVDDADVPGLASELRPMQRDPHSLDSICKMVRNGGLSLFGIPVRVHEVIPA